MTTVKQLMLPPLSGHASLNASSCYLMLLTGTNCMCVESVLCRRDTEGHGTSLSRTQWLNSYAYSSLAFMGPNFNSTSLIMAAKGKSAG